MFGRYSAMPTSPPLERPAPATPLPPSGGLGMSWRNGIGLYGAYFLGVSGIGFTLPFLSPYLAEKGLTEQEIGVLSTVAAVAGLMQFPLGFWSDRVGRRKPFLLVALALLVLATFLLYRAQGLLLVSFLVLLFAENGACRATVESLAGAEATHLAGPGRVGTALGILRFWKPIGIIAVALGGGILAEQYGIGSILVPLIGVQAVAFCLAFLIQERRQTAQDDLAHLFREKPHGRGWKDARLWVFVVAMVLFHTANSPGGVYLSLFLKRDLHASNRTLSHAFIVDMAAWMLVVWPAGRWADRIGRKPLLILAWTIMAVRMVCDAVAGTAAQVVAIEVLDGTANGLFAVLAAAWVTDRFADPRRVGQAQVLVGSCLVFGSAVGPLLSALVVGPLGYRGLFWLLAGIGTAATLLIVTLVPETLGNRREGEFICPMSVESGQATTP
jgi:MFS family permease